MSARNSGKVMISRSRSRLRKSQLNKNVDDLHSHKGPTNINIESKGHISRRNTESILSLKEFMRRAAVRNQYRSFLRTLSKIDDEQWKNQLWSDVSSNYRRNASSTDPMAIKMAFSEGERQLSQLISIVGVTTNNRIELSTDENKDQPMYDISQNDPDSWLNTPDEDDPRGRVGEQWPWQTK